MAELWSGVPRTSYLGVVTTRLCSAAEVHGGKQFCILVHVASEKTFQWKVIEKFCNNFVWAGACVNLFSSLLSAGNGRNFERAERKSKI